MAIINCKECNKEISSDAKNCPYCGAKQKAKTSKFVMGLAILLAVGFVGGLMQKSPEQKEAERFAALTPEQQAKETDDKTAKLARQACKEFIKKDLNDPESAKFDPEYNYEISAGDSNIIKIELSLRAKNAFNALIKQSVDCTVRREDGQWRLMGIAPRK